jgi:hypothetical protein
LVHIFLVPQEKCFDVEMANIVLPKATGGGANLAQARPFSRSGKEAAKMSYYTA